MRRNPLIEFFGCDPNKLREQLIAYFNDNPMSILELSALIGINRQTLGRLLDGRGMQASTMIKIKKFLDLERNMQ
jgi:plasmid maintenance system antidote protein VapI